jgi:hypothetical protein
MNINVTQRPAIGHGIKVAVCEQIGRLALNRPLDTGRKAADSIKR